MRPTRECPIGVGLRPAHYPYLLRWPQTTLKWFEAISENYMDTAGRPLKVLESVRRDYPIALHGVSLSIGSFAEINQTYLKALKNLIAVIDPVRVSDHLCWTGLKDANVHDLLPLPFTEKTIRHVVDKIIQVQDFLGRVVVFENVSSYFCYKFSEMPEWEFITEVSRRSGCQLLLDINNVYVNACNHRFSPMEYLNHIPADCVAQIHLAGFTDMGTHLFDTHARPVFPAVWQLYQNVVGRMLDVPVMIEWDEDIPTFAVLEQEAQKAQAIWRTENERDESRNHAETSRQRLIESAGRT